MELDISLWPCSQHPDRGFIDILALALEASPSLVWNLLTDKTFERLFHDGTKPTVKLFQRGSIQEERLIMYQNLVTIRPRKKQETLEITERLKFLVRCLFLSLRGSDMTTNLQLCYNDVEPCITLIDDYIQQQFIIDTKGNKHGIHYSEYSTSKYYHQSTIHRMDMVDVKYIRRANTKIVKSDQKTNSGAATANVETDHPYTLDWNTNISELDAMTALIIQAHKDHQLMTVAITKQSGEHCLFKFSATKMSSTTWKSMFSILTEAYHMKQLASVTIKKLSGNYYLFNFSNDY
jgi:hypothetical protein